MSTDIPALKPVDWREETVEVAGRIQVLVRRGGTGPPLLYLHGSDGIERAGEFLDLLAAEREVVQPVHPGWPGSDGLDLIDTPLDMALHLGDLVRQLGLAPVPVVGWSIGGMFAAELAATQPELVSHLGLVAATGLWLPEAPVRDVFTLDAEEAARSAWNDPDGEAARRYLTPPEDPEERVELEYRRTTAMAAASKFLWGIPDHGLAGRLYRIQAPALVLWGAVDQTVPPPNADAFAAGIGRASRVVLERAGHCVLRERPEECAAAVRELLASPKPTALTRGAGS